MPRPSRSRRICQEPEYESFIPSGVAGRDAVFLTLDEYEVIRLVDFEKKTHLQCAGQMDISRTTVTEIYENARFKIADCIVNGKTLRIAGGNYRLCEGTAGQCCGTACRKAAARTDMTTVKEKGENEMRVAVTYENGNVFQHFGHTEQFKLYDIEDGKIVKTQIIDTMGSGHGALAGLLGEGHVDTLICGGIGGGAQMALADAGITLYGGVSGDADEAVAAFLAGTLNFNPDVHCSHHGQEHSCGEHHCGGDKHGCAGNH